MPLPFALDHINLWLLAANNGWTAVDCGYGDAATRALWEHHFRDTLAGEPIGARDRDPLPPRSPRQCRMASARWSCAVAMPQAEYLTAHAVTDDRAGYGVGPTSALFRQHGLGEEHVAAIEARGNFYRRGVPELPHAYQRLQAGDEFAIGQTRWRVIPGYGHSPEHGSLYCADLNVLISGDMLLPRISTNVSVWPVEPDGDPLEPLPGVARPFRRSAGGNIGAALARPAFRRHWHPRHAIACPPCRPPGGTRGRRQANRSRRPKCCRSCFAARSISSSASSPWARRLPT